MNATTLQKQENILPGMGVPFTSHPMTGRKEREVLKAIESEPRLASSAQWQVFCTLAVMLSSVGSVEFDDNLTLKQKMAKVETLCLNVGDAFYMYTCIRRQAMGEEVKVRVTCPDCQTSNRYTLHLDEFEVQAAESPAELIKQVQLEHPVVLDGQEYKEAIVKAVNFSPRDAENLTSVEAKCHVMAQCISFPGYEFPVSEELLMDQMALQRRELFDLANSVTPGISEDTTLACSNCERKIPFVISWEFPAFFA